MGQTTPRWRDPRVVPDAPGSWAWDPGWAEWLPAGDVWRLLPPLDLWIYLGVASTEVWTGYGYPLRTDGNPRFCTHCVCSPPRKVMIEVSELERDRVICGRCEQPFVPRGRDN